MKHKRGVEADEEPKPTMEFLAHWYCWNKTIGTPWIKSHMNAKGEWNLDMYFDLYRRTANFDGDFFEEKTILV